ncbi:MAG: efflux RND transporter permease subunit [Planctomycetes bacterium]|nr:efflux RND transporter permease subunit [Planctomycetota bacterium]
MIGLLRAVLRQRILLNLLFLLLLVGGVLAYRTIPVDVYPDVPFNEATVTTVWPGATAKEVELLVTQKIEDELLSLQDVSKLRSRSTRTRSLINIKFDERLTPEQFTDRLHDVRAAVARLNDLPAEAKRPVVAPLTTWELWPLCQVVISGGQPGRVFSVDEEFQSRQVGRALVSALRQIDGIQKVGETFREPEVQIQVHQDKLWSLGVTLTEVADRLRLLNRDFAAGQLNLEGSQFVLNTRGGKEDPARLEELILFERGELGPIRLGDLATVRMGFEEAFVYQRFNRRPALVLSVVKEGAADSVDLVKRIDLELDRFREAQKDELPEGVKVDLVMDSSQIIRSRIRMLVNNLIGGIILVGIVLWLTLGARNAFLALLGIPFSVLCALILFQPMGLTINAISLFSLVLVSGMVVDDAIVVLESIYQRVEAGLEISEAVVLGTAEVIGPVFTSTLTTVCAFLPMLLMDGVMGQYFAVVPKTVAVTLVASLVECFLILPIHYLEFGPRTVAAPPKEEGRGLVLRLADAVARLNRRLIRRPLLVVAGGVLLVAMAGGLASRIPVQLFPSDFNIYAVTAQLPQGSTLEQSRQVAVFIEEKLQGMVDEGEVKYFVSTVGTAWSTDNVLVVASDLVQVTLVMRDDEEHPERLLNKTQRLVKKAFEEAGAPSVRRMIVAAPNDGPPTGKPVQVRLRLADYEQAEAYGRRVEEYLSSIDGVHSVERDLDRGPIRLDLSVRESARALDGVDEAAVGVLFQASNIGAKVGTFKDPRYGEAYDMRVLLAPDDRKGLAGLVASPLRHPQSGELLPVSHFARISGRASFKARPHFDGRRVVTISADVDPQKLTSREVNRLLGAWLSETGIAGAVEHVGLGGEFEETNRSFASLERAFYLAMLLIYVILATQFKSYFQPLIVLVSVPFSFVGVVLGLLAMGIPFTITSFVATVGLSGVVVNDVIVLVAFVNGLRASGTPLNEAVVEGIRRRFRPILMTSVTTILGLMPMALGLGGFSKIWSPFAATMCFGLMSAVFLIVLVVPSLIVLVGESKPREES